MIVLDTDHLTAISFPEHSQYPGLLARMHSASDQNFVTTIVSVEEQIRGWFGSIHRQREVHKQLSSYERLSKFFDFLREWGIARFDARAADEFERLRRARVRIGSMDLKIELSR